MLIVNWISLLVRFELVLKASWKFEGGGGKPPVRRLFLIGHDKCAAECRCKAWQLEADYYISHYSPIIWSWSRQNVIGWSYIISGTITNAVKLLVGVKHWQGNYSDFWHRPVQYSVIQCQAGLNIRKVTLQTNSRWCGSNIYNAVLKYTTHTHTHIYKSRDSSVSKALG
jgi:hypothetical protein